MNRKVWMSLLACMLMVMVVLSGCGAKKEPKEAVQAAMENALKMNSYEFKGTFKINDLMVSNPSFSNDPQSEMMLTMLKNAEVNLTGAFQKDPMQMEMIFDIKLQGDASFSFNIPLVLTKEKIYVKIPNIPMVLLPQNIVGKFLELDLKQLAEQQGEVKIPNYLDTAKTQEFAQEFTKILFSKFDGASYFKNVDKKDAKLPDGIDAKQIVKFNITSENFEQAATTLVKDVFPQVLDLMTNDKYKDVFKVTSDGVAKIKKDLENDSQFKTALAEIKKSMKINELSMTTALNKDDFPAYQDAKANLEFNNEGTTVKFDVIFSSQYLKINAKPDFKIGIPKDIVTMDQLQQSYGGVMQP